MQTGRVIGACLYYLSKNKQVQNKLRAELISLLPSKDDPITNEVLNQAHYLKASVKEALRLAPIAVGVNRVNPVDLVLSGYQIPKGVNKNTSCILFYPKFFICSLIFLVCI